MDTSGHDRRRHILTVTLHPALDLTACVPRVAADRKLHCTASERTPGGGGINVARGIRRLGGTATALFPAGGSSGALVRELLDDEGVPVIAVPVVGVTRDDMAIEETATGHEYRFVLPGPPLLPDELGRCVDEVVRQTQPGSLVVLSGSLPPGSAPAVMADIIGAVRDGGGTIVVDTSDAALVAVAATGVFLLKPSVNELSRHVGRPLPNVEAIVEAAEELRRAGPSRAVLVSRGAQGAVLVTADEATVVITPPAVRVVSTVGAGDSLVGGLVLALATGTDLVEAARYSVATGTAATVAPGHKLCAAEVVERLLPRVQVSGMDRAAAR